MSSRPTSRSNAGTDDPGRPGVDDSPIITEGWYWHTAGDLEGRTPTDSSPATIEDWHWQTASDLDPRTPAEQEAHALAAAAARSARRRRGATVVMRAAAVLAVFSAGVLYADLRSPRETATATTSGAPAPRTPPAPTATVVVPAPRNLPVVTQPGGAVRGAPPVRISIPALNIDQRLIGLRVNADRQLEVPQNYNDIGWWSTGPVAGDPGAAVIVGHVDSMVGPAVFYRLSSLARGAVIAVRRADGTTVRFTVTKLQLFSKDHFPDKLVYRTAGRPSLHLVTCGGSYDRSTGYRDNVVVFADLVEPTPPSKPRQTVRPQAGVQPRSPAQHTVTARRPVKSTVSGSSRTTK